ncbi:hypothetical protein LCGC14_3052950 [marine sediment metagenome]|uniref:Uncharacterized protein n=1 Tax=marine sediment metagenome TaxID=412755 RepID=A0A0F8WL35_9ZZZZ
MKKQTKKKKRKQTAWIKHVLNYKKKHPNKTFGESMKLAKASYNPNRK